MTSNITGCAFPTGLVRLEEARRRHGPRVDDYAPYFYRGDPPADAVVEDFSRLGPGAGRRMLEVALARGLRFVPDAPESLCAYVEAAERVPAWVDWERYALGARTFQRGGVATNIVLSCVSLMTAYRSSIANRPLVFTGQLEKMAQRRLAETGRYVVAVCQERALARHRAGFALTLRVRLMHAEVRRMLARSPRWDAAAWGSPINQANMSGTTMLFSYALIQGMRRLGFRITRREGDALMHVWRYAGLLMGVEEPLLFDTEDQAAELYELGNLIQPGADEQGRALAAALSKVPSQHARNGLERAVGSGLIRYMDGLTRALNGDEFADDLHIGHRAWRHALAPTRAFVGAAEALRLALPDGTRLAARGGNWAMHHGIAVQLRGKEPAYEAPPKLVAEPGVALGRAAFAA